MSNIKRYGNIIAVREGMLEHYIELHRNQPEEIRNLLKAAGCRKCDIYTVELDGKTYLFQSAEIDESKTDVDLRCSPAYMEWERQTSECQTPILGARLWKQMECVYTLEDNGKEGKA